MTSPAFVTPPKQPQPGPDAPKKGGFPWLYVLLGCGGIMFLGLAAVFAAGYFVVKKGTEIASEIKKDMDERVKIKQGDKDGKGASIEIKSPGLDGETLTVGGDNKEPDWMPIYPGSKSKSHGNVHTPKEEIDTYTFNISDTPEDVSKFYNEKLKASGFESQVNNGSQEGILTSLVSASNKSTGHGVQITAIKKGDEPTIVTVVAVKSVNIKKPDTDVEEK